MAVPRASGAVHHSKKAMVRTRSVSSVSAGTVPNTQPRCTVASFQAGCPSVKAKIQNFLEKTDRIGAAPLQAPSTQCIQWGSAWSGGGSGTAASPTWCSWDGHTKVALWVWHLWTKCTPKTKTPHVSSLSQSCSIRNVPTLLGLAALSPQPSTALGSGAAPASPREHPKEERSVQCGASIVGTAR